MSTICAAAYPITGCRKRYEIIPSCGASAGLRCCKAFAAFILCCGTKHANGSSRSVKSEINKMQFCFILSPRKIKKAHPNHPADRQTIFFLELANATGSQFQVDHLARVRQRSVTARRLVRSRSRWVCAPQQYRPHDFRKGSWSCGNAWPREWQFVGLRIGEVLAWLCPHRGREWPDAHDVHHAGQIVAKYVQRHL